MRFRKRKDPDYAFEKLSDEEIEFQKRSNKRTLLMILCAIVVLGIFAEVIFLTNTNYSYETQNPKGELIITLPENKSEYEIYPGGEFIFDIIAHYEVGDKITYYGITDHDRCQIGMFFSDNRLCQRTAYDTIILNEDVKVGTEFAVTLKYNNQISTVEFLVIEKPAQDQQNNQ